MTAFDVEVGDRIAQLLVTPFAAEEPVEVSDLDADRPRRRRLRLERPLRFNRIPAVT